VAKPETTFYESLHRHLPEKARLHREKMANPYTGGTADVWYSGDLSDLWVEYKFIEVPKRDATMIDLCKFDMLSGLQQEWIKGRVREGRNVWVIVGCREGGVIFKGLEWTTGPFAAGRFREWIDDRKIIAGEIASHCLKGT
jgi:hypothetical protein